MRDTGQPDSGGEAREDLTATESLRRGLLDKFP